MPGTNVYKEHLLYDENERSAKNIDIGSGSCQLFHPYKHCMDPCHPRKHFMDPRHLFDQRQTFMNLRHPRTHAPMLPTPPTLFSRLKHRT